MVSHTIFKNVYKTKNFHMQIDFHRSNRIWASPAKINQSNMHWVKAGFSPGVCSHQCVPEGIASPV